MKPLVICFAEGRRLVRDRTNLFFLFVFPVVLILLLGAAFGGDLTPKLGVLVQDQGELADHLVSELRSDESIAVELVSERDELLDEVERGIFEGGIIIGPDYTDLLTGGDDVAVEYIAQPGDFGAAIRTTVDAAIGEQAAIVRAARVAESEGGASFDEAVATAKRVTSSMSGSNVVFGYAGEPPELDSDDRFGSGAATQLILFTFVNSLAGSVSLIQTRQYGVLTRMLSTPTSAGSILAGQMIGRFLVAALQGVFIIFTAALLFGVRWGDPLGAAAILVLFSLVSTGVAMAFGSILSTEQQAGALVPFGLALAALGGSMVPLEIFPDTMRSIARITPHAWANEAFHELRTHGASAADVLPQLGMLALFAGVLMLVGTLLLRRRLTT